MPKPRGTGASSQAWPEDAHDGFVRLADGSRIGLGSGGRDVKGSLAQLLVCLNRAHERIVALGSGDVSSALTIVRDLVAEVADLYPQHSLAVFLYNPATDGVACSPEAASGTWPVNWEGTAELARQTLARRTPSRRVHENRSQDRKGLVWCTPLLGSDVELGVLCATRDATEPSDPEDTLFLQSMAGTVTLALQRGLAADGVKGDSAEAADELERLRHAGMLISSRLGLDETLESILQMAMEVTAARYGNFRLLDSRGQLVTRALTGPGLLRPLVEALPLDEHSVMGWVAVHRTPVRIDDLRLEPWSRVYHPLDAQIEMRSELTVPLIDASGRLEGVLNLESPEVGAFHERHSHLLQSLATSAVIAIQEARLLDALQEVAQLLLTRPSREVLGRLVDLACDLLNASCGALWICNKDQAVLEVASEGYSGMQALSLRDSLAGQVLQANEPASAVAASTAPNSHVGEVPDSTQALYAPVVATSDARPLGVLSVYLKGDRSRRAGALEWERKVLTLLARYAALALHGEERQRALGEAQEQRAVAETFAVVGDVAANLLHQLNNKVGTIPVRVQGIQDKCGSSVAADPYLAANLREIERSSVEAMQAVRETLVHLHPIHVTEVDVSTCVEQAVQGARLPSGVRIEIEELSSLPAVSAGLRSLSLVFENLLNNATEAMNGQGVITIRGAARSDRVEVAISDSGPGIDPTLQDAIFEFSPMGGSTRASRLGFGLWWVKTLMARLGGSVSVESDGQHGATFHLSLPTTESRR